MPVRVIDTDVWSYLYKAADEAKLYEPHLFGNVLVISFQTQAELLRGVIAANWGARRRQHLESRIKRYVIEHSSDALSLRWAVILHFKTQPSNVIGSNVCVNVALPLPIEYEA